MLRYLNEADFRRGIRAETTKIEAYHGFLDWVSFGGPRLRTGDPVEQEKRIKYQDLVANAVMLSNVVDLTEALNGIAADGYEVRPEQVRRLSP